jgi:hypothetical protein
MESAKKCRWLHTFGGQIAVFTGAMLLLAGTLIAVVWHWHGSEMAGVAAVLAGICYAASALAFLGERALGRQAALAGMVASMAFRTGIPLAAVIVMKLSGGRFAEPEAIAYLLILYFGALMAHVVISYGSLKASCAAELDDYVAK